MNVKQIINDAVSGRRFGWRTPKDAYEYALRTPDYDRSDVEPIISTDGLTSYMYALDVLKHNPFPAGEKVIAQDAELSYSYAMHILKGQFPAGEPVMAKEARNVRSDNQAYLGWYLEFLHDNNMADYIKACVRLGVEPEL